MRKALYILGDLDDADVAWLARAGRRSTIAAGQVLIRAGEPVPALSIVVEGRLRVLTPAGEAVAELSVGDIVGEMTLIERRPPSVSVVAATDARLLSVEWSALRPELEHNVGFASRFYRAIAVFLSARLRMTVGRLGHGAPDDPASGMEQDELDEGLLETVSVAGFRMSRLIALFDGRQG